jgi:uncharacterized linocin/CFP29 family protein
LVTLTDQQYKYIDEAVQWPPRQILIGRRVARTFGPLGEGKLTVEWNKISEVGAAQMFRSQKVTLNEDIIDNTVGSLDVPALARGFRIPRRSLEASRTYGTPLDVATAKSASYQVSILEDTLVLKGSGGIDGLYDSAGNDYSTTKHWSTATNIMASINGAIALLKADKIFPPYNLVVNDARFDELFEFITNTSEFYYDAVQRRIGGQIFQTPVLDSATGMLLATPDAGFFDLPLGVDVHAEVEELPLDQFKDLYGVVWEAITPRIREANAICKLSDIA